MMLDQPGPVLQPAESETPAAATDVLTVVWAALLDAAYTRSQKSGRQGQGVPRLRGQRARARAWEQSSGQPGVTTSTLRHRRDH